MHNLLRESRHALRRLFRRPGTTLVAVITMALGIGLTGSMFSIIDAIVLRGLPFEDQDRLLHLECSHLAQGINSMEVTHHDFEDWREEQTSFEDLVAMDLGTVNLSDEGLPDRYSGAWVTPNFLGQLRVIPQLGRGFLPEDAAPGAERVALLSYRVWQKRYGEKEDILGRAIRVNSQSATVVGILPPDFHFPANEDVWMPLMSISREYERGEGDTLEVFGRLRDGISPDQAALEMASITSRLANQYPKSNEGIGSVVKPFIHEFIGEDIRLLLSVMLGAVLLVLLIACFNVTNLLLGRASERTRELAIRTALGSERWRLVTGVMSEALLIAIAGATVGIFLAHFAVQAIADAVQTINPPYWMKFYVSPLALVAVTAATLVSAFLAGIVPALRASKGDVQPVLQDTERGASFKLGMLSRILVIAEVAISCVLMIGAGLMVMTVVQVNSYDLKLDTENVLVARLGLFEGDYPEKEDWNQFYEQLLRNVSSQSEVARVALGTSVPAETLVGTNFTLYQRRGETYQSTREMPFARLTEISPGYFDTLSVQLVAGRDFTVADRLDTPAVAIVNEDFARKEWPGENPIGQRINLWLGSEIEKADPNAGWVEVVGLAPDLRQADFDQEDDQQGIYVPLSQFPKPFTWIVVRTQADPMAFVPALQRTVFNLDANLPLYFLRSMDQVIAQTLFLNNLLGVLFSVFGLVALVLASIGLYGVMAFGVTRRTREMGIRMAFGAKAQNILSLIIGRGLRQVSLGLAIGLALSLATGRLLQGFLFQVEPFDAKTFLIVIAVVLSVSVLACFIPARRASAVDPITALRQD